MVFFKERIDRVTNLSKKVIGTKDIVDNFKYGVEATKVLIGKSDDNINSRIIDPNKKPKTFAQIIKEQRLKPNDLADMSKRYGILFYIFFIATLTCFGSAIHALFMPNLMEIIFQLLPSISIAAFLSVFTIRFGLSAYQINNQELTTVKEYLSKGMKIFPPLKQKQ